MLPSGTFGEQVVPVINESLFKWIIREPHNRKLRDAWEVATSEPTCQKKVYILFDILLHLFRWGDMTFSFHNVAYRPLEPQWDPARDIDFG